MLAANYNQQAYTTNHAKMLADLPSLEKYATFPYPESNHLEFKKSIDSCGLQKIYETICAILNSGGGHIIIGIEDETRRIVGVKCNKGADNFILNIDNIFHRSIIVKYKGAKPVPIKSITAEYMRAIENKTVLVITIMAEKEELYSLKDGTIWYRLNASNYRHTGIERMYSESEFNGALKEKVKEKLKEQTLTFISERDKLIHKFKALEEDLKNIMGSAKKIEGERTELRDLLFGLILQQKEEAIAAAAAAAKPPLSSWSAWFSYLCCGSF